VDWCRTVGFDVVAAATEPSTSRVHHVHSGYGWDHYGSPPSRWPADFNPKMFNRSSTHEVGDRDAAVPRDRAAAADEGLRFPPVDWTSSPRATSEGVGGQLTRVNRRSDLLGQPDGSTDPDLRWASTSLRGGTTTPCVLRRTVAHRSERSLRRALTGLPPHCLELVSASPPRSWVSTGTPERSRRCDVVAKPILGRARSSTARAVHGLRQARAGGASLVGERCR